MIIPTCKVIKRKKKKLPGIYWFPYSVLSKNVNVIGGGTPKTVFFIHFFDRYTWKLRTLNGGKIQFLTHNFIMIRDQRKWNSSIKGYNCIRVIWRKIFFSFSQLSKMNDINFKKIKIGKHEIHKQVGKCYRKNLYVRNRNWILTFMWWFL